MIASYKKLWSMPKHVFVLEKVRAQKITRIGAGENPQLDCFIFMPPTLKKLMGHIAFGACVGAWVGAWVGHTFCTYCNF